MVVVVVAVVAETTGKVVVSNRIQKFCLLAKWWHWPQVALLAHSDSCFVSVELESHSYCFQSYWLILDLWLSRV